MFVFKRAFSSSNAVYKMTGPVSLEEANAKLAEFLKFRTTPAKLRRLIYNPKRAKELVSRDLRDKETGLPLTQAPLPPYPSKEYIRVIIRNANTSAELLSVTKLIATLNRYSKYVNRNVLDEILLRGAQLGQYGHVLHLAVDAKKHRIYSNIAEINDLTSFYYLNSKLPTAEKIAKVEKFRYFVNTGKNYFVEPLSAIDRELGVEPKKVDTAKLLLETPVNQAYPFQLYSILLQGKDELSSEEFDKQLQTIKLYIDKITPVELQSLDGEDQAKELRNSRLTYIGIQAIKQNYDSFAPEFKDNQYVKELLKFSDDYEMLESKVGNGKLADQLNFQYKSLAEVREAEEKEEQKQEEKEN